MKIKVWLIPILQIEKELFKEWKAAFSGQDSDLSLIKQEGSLLTENDSLQWEWPEGWSF